MAGVWLVNHDKSEGKEETSTCMSEQKGVDDEEKIGKTNVAQTETQNAHRKQTR